MAEVGIVRLKDTKRNSLFMSAKASFSSQAASPTTSMGTSTKRRSLFNPMSSESKLSQLTATRMPHKIGDAVLHVERASDLRNSPIQKSKKLSMTAQFFLKRSAEQTNSNPTTTSQNESENANISISVEEVEEAKIVVESNMIEEHQRPRYTRQTSRSNRSVADAGDEQSVSRRRRSGTESPALSVSVEDEDVKSNTEDGTSERPKYIRQSSRSQRCGGEASTPSGDRRMRSGTDSVETAMEVKRGSIRRANSVTTPRASRSPPISARVVEKDEKKGMFDLFNRKFTKKEVESPEKIVIMRDALESDAVDEVESLGLQHLIRKSKRCSSLVVSSPSSSRNCTNAQ